MEGSGVAVGEGVTEGSGAAVGEGVTEGSCVTIPVGPVPVTAPLLQAQHTIIVKITTAVKIGFLLYISYFLFSLYKYALFSMYF